MDFTVIGKEIKNIRQELGISQSELSDGICTQSQISKIEKGEVYPLANTLYFIAEKLGVDVNYFYELATIPHLEYVKSLKDQVRKGLNSYNYTEVYNIIEGEKKNPLFVNNRNNLQFLLWNEGICIFHMKKDKKNAMRLLEEALELTKMTNKLIGEREIEIINSMAIIYSETGEYEKALDKFNIAYNHFNKLPFMHDYSIKTKILYNTARTLTKNLDYNKAISISREGIEWCINNNSLYLLGSLYYHIGYNYDFLKEFDTSVTYYNKAITVFELQNNNSNFISYIKSKINGLQIKN
ncbi:helix-turn-helix domain-containing protein [Bacillus alkalisoli]|uniref:helix-turn-helix domain-containing protein n=1 Tax=Bacillus alkalisoli TaxID=2011008 RepID=UPI000C246886|nr:helix-turn-helix domain-containing protein [Bacillus alkalisoli]